MHQCVPTPLHEMAVTTAITTIQCIFGHHVSVQSIAITFKFLLILLKACAGISHSVDCASPYTCVIQTNKMHFFFLIYFNYLSYTCSNRVTIHHQEAVTVYAAFFPNLFQLSILYMFKQSNNSSSGGSYCICSIWYLPCIYIEQLLTRSEWNCVPL